MGHRVVPKRESRTRPGTATRASAQELEKREASPSATETGSGVGRSIGWGRHSSRVGGSSDPELASPSRLRARASIDLGSGTVPSSPHPVPRSSIPLLMTHGTVGAGAALGQKRMPPNLPLTRGSEAPGLGVGLSRGEGEGDWPRRSLSSSTDWRGCPRWVGRTPRNTARTHLGPARLKGCDGAMFGVEADDPFVLSCGAQSESPSPGVDCDASPAAGASDENLVPGQSASVAVGETSRVLG